MVLSLERVRQYEDRNLLSAHIMVLLEKDYTQAQVRERNTHCFIYAPTPDSNRMRFAWTRFVWRVPARGDTVKLPR